MKYVDVLLLCVIEVRCGPIVSDERIWNSLGSRAQLGTNNEVCLTGVCDTFINWLRSIRVSQISRVDISLTGDNKIPKLVLLRKAIHFVLFHLL